MMGKTGSMREVLTTACPLDCPDGCSLAVTVEDGRIVAIDADTGPDANPFTQGYICKKVKHQARRVYAPERVLTPLIATGPKGSGQFRSASWDEAIGLIADRIRAAIDTDGVRAVVPYLYSSSAGILASDGLTPMLFERLGCPEVEHTICAATASAAWRQVYGGMLSADPFDLQYSKLVVVWGANPNASNTHLVPLITKAVKGNGAKVIVVDPRRTGVAARADLHLAIRPGTDVVLAYAVTRLLGQNATVDIGFLRDSTDGADRFLAAAEEWTVERAAVECGIDGAQIETFATMLAANSPAMLRIGWGLERNRNGGSACVAVLSMWAATGHFGVRGSGIIKSTSGAAPVDPDGLWPEDVVRGSRPTLSMNDVGLALLGHDVGAGPHRAAEPWPQTKVLFVQGANPVATAMDQGEFMAGMERADLFTVVHDQVLTDTAVRADVVLPATTQFEAADLASAYGTFSLQQIKPVIGRVGESMTNDEVAALLAARLGLPAGEFDPDPVRLIERVRTDGRTDSRPRLRDPGTTVQFIDVYPSFADGSKRARLYTETSELPLPGYVAPASDGLAMLTPSSNRTINTMFAEFDPPEAAISIHPTDAGERGIADGDQVRVFNDLGEIRVVARLDGSVRPGVTSIPKGLWCRTFDNGRTPNSLISRGINDLVAGACFNDSRIQIEPCLAALDPV